MFVSEISTDGETFKPLFVEGRLRNYTNLNNALNGSRQILRNPKKHCVLIRILDKDTNKIIAYIRKTESGFDVNMIEDENKKEETLLVKDNKDDEKKVEEKFKDLKKPIAALNNKFSNTLNQHDIKKNDREKLPIDDLILNKNEDSVEKKENRIEELKKAHDLWEEKKSNTENIKVGDSVNNIADNHSVKKVNAVYSELMNKMVLEAIQRSDLNKLFRLEFLLSKSGYSWYPKNGKVEIDSTENVVNMLKEHPELLEP